MRKFRQTAPTGASSPGGLAGQGACAPSKWTLLQVIEDIREPLGLKGTSIALLRSMISFVKGDQITAAREDGHICFASNAALASRTHVSIQTVERHIARLVDLGLVTRRSSPNGKRWARRDTGGRVVLATGLSLLPLVRRHPEFNEQAQRHKEHLASLSILRDKCAIGLARLKACHPNLSDIETLVHTARNLLRKRPAQNALQALLSDITAEIQSVTGHETLNSRGMDVQNEGHKEPHMTQSVKKGDHSEIKVGPTDMERAFPRLCTALRTSRNQSECERRMDDCASYLALGALWPKIKELGPTRKFMLLGYMLERADNIKNPCGYAMHLFHGLTRGSIDWYSLLAQGGPAKVSSGHC